MARCPANRVAPKIFKSSISCSEAVPTLHACAWDVIAANSVWRWSSERSLESSNASKDQRCGRMTTAATTGPANGPRPASSSPAICLNPQAQADASKKSVGPVLISRDGKVKAWTARASCYGNVEKSRQRRSRLAGRTFLNIPLGVDVDGLLGHYGPWK